MKVYFAIEENISNTSSKGTKYICKGGIRKSYGEFTEKNGHLSLHKVNLEIENAKKFYQTCTHLSSADVWAHYYEEYEI